MVVALVLSDVHDNIMATKAIINTINNYDLIIMAGDICEFNCIDFYKLFQRISAPIIMVHGNHDCVPCFRVFEEKLDNFYYISNDYIEIEFSEGPIVIGGLGGVYSEKRSDMHHFSPNDIVEFANKLLKNNIKLDLLVTHECARKCSDIIPRTRNRGGRNELYLWQIIAKPKIHVCGHMHTPWIERFGEILCVNPGYGFIGLGALIDLKRTKAKIFQVKVKANLVEEHRVIYTYNWVRNVKRSYFRILNCESSKLRGGL